MGPPYWEILAEMIERGEWVEAVGPILALTLFTVGMIVLIVLSICRPDLVSGKPQL